MVWLVGFFSNLISVSCSRFQLPRTAGPASNRNGQKRNKLVWEFKFVDIFLSLFVFVPVLFFRGPAFGSFFFLNEWWCETPTSKSYGIYLVLFLFFSWIIISFLNSYLLKLFGVSFYKYNAPICTYWRSPLIDSWSICFPFLFIH